MERIKKATLAIVNFFKEVYRFHFPKRETKDLNEFLNFVNGVNQCRYVALYCKQRVRIESSDQVTLEWHILAHTMNRRGFVFSYDELVAGSSSDDFEYWEKTDNLCINLLQERAIIIRQKVAEEVVLDISDFAGNIIQPNYEI